MRPDLTQTEVKRAFNQIGERLAVLGRGDEMQGVLI